MFKVPEQLRVRKGAMASDGSFGNNGMFVFKDLTELVPDNQGLLTRVPYFIFAVASDQQGWEHVSLIIHTIATPRSPIMEEITSVRNAFWGKDDDVFIYLPSAKFKDDNPRCCHLWRKPGADMLVPPPDLYGLVKKSGLLTIAKSIITGI